MARRTSRTSSQPEISTKAKIRAAYLDYVLTRNRSPASVYIFSKRLGMAEADFYEHYTSFEAIEADYWRDGFETTQAKVTADAAWENFKIREKVLLFAFTLLEILLPQRSFAVFSLRGIDDRGAKPLEQMRGTFMSFFEPLVTQAIEAGELANRKFLRERYTDALWMQTQFVLRFWASDASEGFEKTDEVIEKGYHLIFDLLGRSAIDSAIDYGKFLARNRIVR
jgi:AcrR family transcriptional regulator